MIIVRGKVRHGKNRGKALGFPTANINLHRKIPEGVYISFTKVRRHTYKSLSFVGNPKTFGDNNYRAETYLINFRKDLYGEWIAIYLLKKIRENKNFESPNKLVKQMQEDLQKANKIHSQYKLVP